MKLEELEKAINIIAEKENLSSMEVLDKLPMKVGKILKNKDEMGARKFMRSWSIERYAYERCLIAKRAIKEFSTEYSQLNEGSINTWDENFMYSTDSECRSKLEKYANVLAIWGEVASEYADFVGGYSL